MTQQSPPRLGGWSVVLAALAINLVIGVLYAWSVMAKALVMQWHWKASDAALPFTISAASFALMMVFAGRWQDKIGPRWIAVSAGIVLGLGMIACSFIRTPQGMWLTFGLIGGVGIGLGYSATTPPAIKWFPPSRKGRITGIVVSGVGLAAVYIAPLTQWLLGITTVSNTFLILGFGTIILVCSLALFLKNPPPGYVPPTGDEPIQPMAQPHPNRRDLDWHEMLRSPQFYQLWLMFVLAASAGLMIISQMALIAKDQAHIDRWGFAPVAILALFNTFGRVLSGFLSDRLGRANTILLAFVLQALNMFIFASYQTPALLMFGAAFTGLCYGTIFTLFPAATADFYGTRNFGANYGLVFTGFGVAGVVGPIIGAAVRDSFHSYHHAFDISAVLLLMGAGLALALKTPKPELNSSPAVAAKEQNPNELVSKHL